ncbi:MAG: SOS response-associated peptidase [Rhizobiales bacterium]|nr:SOS response-associated peptidase [Hyphomicrobiales bacterium]
MCGRYVIISAPEAIRRLFDYAEQPNFPPRYNIAPTQPVPVVVMENGARHFRLMRWGLIPAWVKDPRTFSLVINARSETVLDKPAFRNAMRRRRCLLPADGYYEWQAQSGAKQPFFIRPLDGRPMGFAGLAETWTGPNGEEVDTVAIITTAARPEMSHLHHRVPVTIGPEDFGRWLGGNDLDAEGAATMLIAPPSGSLTWHEVTSAVNKVGNDDPRLIRPMTDEERVAAETAAPSKKPARAEKPRRQAGAAGDGGQGSLF